MTTSVHTYGHNHNLSTSAINRYSRQLILDEFGVLGQQCVQSCKLLIIGAGGLGSPVSLYCGAAGFEHITIVDNDTVDISNLHRQIIHKETHINDNNEPVYKAISAKQAIEQLNTSCVVNAVCQRFDYSIASTLVSQHDIIIDCSDNVATRYLINDTAVLYNKPVVSGSALRLEGQCTVYNYYDHYTKIKSPCYRCLYPIPPRM